MNITVCFCVPFYWGIRVASVSGQNFAVGLQILINKNDKAAHDTN